jgi:ketosteroid isomerase-like protein
MSSIPGAHIEWEPIEAHVASSADMAYLIERNRVSFQDSTGATVTETNKVVTVWRKQPDESWKNVIDMWNADPSP